MRWQGLNGCPQQIREVGDADQWISQRPQQCEDSENPRDLFSTLCLPETWSSLS